MRQIADINVFFRPRAAALSIGALCLLTLSSCAPKKPSKARLQDPGKHAQAIGAGAHIAQTPVVRVNGEEVSLAELNQRVRRLPEFARVRYAGVSQKQSWLTSVARFEVMADVAEKKGLGNRNKVYFALKQAMADQLLEDVVRQKLTLKDIDQAAIKAYYQAHRAQFHTPAARRVALIELPTRKQAVEIRQRALSEIARSKDGAVNAFRRAAAAYSTDRAVAVKGGDIGFIPVPNSPNNGDRANNARNKVPKQVKRPAIAEAVYALEKPGEISLPFALDPGWGLATFIEERPARTLGLKKASGDIRQKLYQRQSAAIKDKFIASLRQKADIQRYSKRLKHITKPSLEPTLTFSEIALHAEPAFGTTREVKDKKAVPQAPKNP